MATLSLPSICRERMWALAQGSHVCTRLLLTRAQHLEGLSATPEAPHHPLGPATTQWKTELTQTLTSRLGSEGSRRGRANQSPAEHPQPTPRGGGRMFGHHLPSHSNLLSGHVRAGKDHQGWVQPILHSLRHQSPEKGAGQLKSQSTLAAKQSPDPKLPALTLCSSTASSLPLQSHHKAWPV